MFIEIGVLVSDLPSFRFEVKIVDVHHLPGHGAVRNIKDAVEMQALLFGRAFPYTHALPAFSVGIMPQAGA